MAKITNGFRSRHSKKSDNTMAKITNGLSEAVIQRNQTIQWQRQQTGQKPSFKEVGQYNGKDNKRVRSRHSKKSENTMAKITKGFRSRHSKKSDNTMAKITNGFRSRHSKKSDNTMAKITNGYRKPSFKEVRQYNGKDNKQVIRSRHSKKSDNAMAKITNRSEAVIQRSQKIQWQR